MASNPIRVVLVDDHPIVRAGMRMVLAGAEDIQILADGACGADALRLVGELQPDVLVLDVNLPDMNGLEVTRRLCAQGSAVRILILTVQYDRQMVLGLLEAGAKGYVMKDDALEMLPNGIRAVARGETWLSSQIAGTVVEIAVIKTVPPPRPPTGLTLREMEVLRLLAQGLSNEAISQKLTLTMRTVQNHVSAIYGKLGVESRAEAVLYAIRAGWVEVPLQKHGLDTN
jgi:DNA-binding NarL/FixJ family response regulator